MNRLDYNQKKVYRKFGLSGVSRDQVFETMLKAFCDKDFCSVNPRRSHSVVLAQEGTERLGGRLPTS